MTTPQPLTRDEASKWPALGPMNLDPARVLALFDALEAAIAERDEARAVCELLAGPDSNPAVMVAAARTEAQRLVAVEAERDEFAQQRDRAMASERVMREALENALNSRGLAQEQYLRAALTNAPQVAERWLADIQSRAVTDFLKTAGANLLDHPSAAEMAWRDGLAEHDAAVKAEARRARDAEWTSAIATWNDPGAQHDFDIAKALSAFGDAWSQSHEALGARCDAYKELLAKEKANHAATANDLTEALKLRDKLREALTCWGVHDPGCPGKNEGPNYCTCGLAAARGGQR